MILLILISQLMAQDVMIQGESTPDVAYEKRLVSDPNLQSYIQHLQSQDTKNNLKLQSTFKQAQFEFLQGSLEKAADLYGQISDMQHKARWTLSEQRIIHYSFLRLAQLSKADRNNWLTKAFIFHPEMEVDDKLFPPPLVDQYRRLQESTPMNVWTLPNKTEEFDQIFINGRTLPKGSRFFRYRPGRVRIDFLSNTYQPVTLVTDLKELETIKVSLHPLASGTCQVPKFYVEGSEKFRLLNENCLSGKMAGTGAKTLEKWQAATAKPQPGPSFLKNKWFWVGVSVVATGLTLHSLKQRESPRGAPPAASSGPQEFSNN